MLSSTRVPVCARCGSEKIRKNGPANHGAQRARCLEGGRTFILEPAGPRDDRAFKEAVARAYRDRLSTATFGRLTPARFLPEPTAAAAAAAARRKARPTTWSAGLALCGRG